MSDSAAAIFSLYLEYSVVQRFDADKDTDSTVYFDAYPGPDLTLNSARVITHLNYIFGLRKEF